MSEHEKLRSELERLAAGYVAGRGLRERAESRIRQRQQRRRAAVAAAAALVVAGAVAAPSLIGSDIDDSVLHPTPTTESRSDPSSDDPCEGEPILIADLDGDGRDDEVFGRWVSQEGEPTAPGAGDYALGACTAAGERAALRGVGSEVIRAVDVEGDGRAELLVGGTSASATFLDVVVFVDGDLDWVASKGSRIQLLEGNLAWDEDAAAPAEAAAVGCEDLDGDGRAELVQVTTSFTSVEASWTKQGFTLDGAGAEPTPPVAGVEPSIDDDRLGFTATLTPACQDASGKAATDCELGASFSDGPQGWIMTVSDDPGGGGGPPGWWHIEGPEEGRSIQILRGPSPYPPGDTLVRQLTVDGAEAMIYEIHDGMALSISVAGGDDPSCEELHVLGWGISEQDLRTIADGIQLSDDR